MCLVIKRGLSSGEEAVGSGVVVIPRDGVEPEGRAVDDAIDWGDDDGGVPARAVRMGCLNGREIVVDLKCWGS